MRNERKRRNRGNAPNFRDVWGGEVSLLYCRSQYSFAMLASKSLMLAKTLLNKPASLQFAAQRFMSAAPDMKVQPKETKPVVVRSACDA